MSRSTGSTKKNSRKLLIDGVFIKYTVVFTLLFLGIYAYLMFVSMFNAPTFTYAQF